MTPHSFPSVCFAVQGDARGAGRAGDGGAQILCRRRLGRRGRDGRRRRGVPERGGGGGCARRNATADGELEIDQGEPHSFLGQD